MKAIQLRQGRHNRVLVYRQLGHEPSDQDELVLVATGTLAEYTAATVVAVGNDALAGVQEAFWLVPKGAGPSLPSPVIAAVGGVRVLVRDITQGQYSATAEETRAMAAQLLWSADEADRINGQVAEIMTRSARDEANRVKGTPAP